MADTRLELKRVSVSRDGNRILDEISLQVQAGENLTVLGPSGCGKTTLLRLLNRLDEPSNGTIFLDGRDVRTYEVMELRRLVGMVFQTSTMFDGTVEANITFGPRIRGDAVEARELLDLVGLDPGMLERPADRLSVGEKQRVELARVLANRPEVLLLDEPTSGLDVASASRVLGLFEDLSRRLGVTVVFVTHVLEQAERLADRVGLLVNGRLESLTTRSAFFARDRGELERLFHTE